MTIQEIEAAIVQLPADQLAELTAWPDEYHAQVWDQRIEDDANAGCLDALLDEVDKECETGQARPL